ncbi:DNA repair protein RecN [bacterium]|nr:DNA repair protein RecN [bacterium]
MLQLIQIHDFILAREISFELGAGLNVITGETGAGKTIVINALKYGIGENLSKELFDFSRQQPNVVLHFSIPHPDQFQWFELDPEEEIICQRITKNTGKTLAYINGVHVPLPLYRDFCRQLLQIHGQNDTEQLFSTTTQKKLFDRFFAGTLQPSIDQIESLRNQYITIKRELKKLYQHEQDRVREIDFLRYQIHEIEEASLREDEWEVLLEQREILTHRENIKAALQQAQKLFQPEQPFSTLYPQLVSLLNQTAGLKQYSDELNSVSESFQTILTLMKESERDIEHSIDAIMAQDSEQLLYSVLSRIDLIKNLQRKFGETIPAILRTKANLSEQLSVLQHQAEKTSSLEKSLRTITQSLTTLCLQISQNRTTLSEEFICRMEKELADVSLSKVKMNIQIEQEEAEETEDALLIDHHWYRLFPDGIDKVQYLVSTNPGQPYLPLSKIASGGELSRFMLALKSLLGKLENVDTLIFDEIDAGIGGVTAHQVGLKCRDLAKSKQIICITHLPQIASKGQHHFVIDKIITDNQTSLSLKTVENQERIEEITRMLGEPYSEASKQLAKSMLET